MVIQNFVHNNNYWSKSNETKINYHVCFRTQVDRIDNTDGLVESILVSSILGEHDGRFTIAEVKFTALGTGTSPLERLGTCMK